MAKNEKAVAEVVEYRAFKEEGLAKEKELVEGKGKEFKPEHHEYKPARDYIRKFLFPNKELMEDLGDMGLAILDFVGAGNSGSAKAKGPRSIGVGNFVKEALVENKALTESDVFMLTMEKGNAWGRKAMRDFIKKMVQMPAEDRLWIDFVASDQEESNMGTYYLLSVGEEAPEGWEGPTPKEAVPAVIDI